MLVLSRRCGECVHIGEHIQVKVLEISAGRVKLGFTAPPEMSIQRNEIRGAYPIAPETWVPCSVVMELCAP